MDNNEALQQIIKEQEERIKFLEEQLLTVKDHIRRLSICKLTDPNHLYYNFIVEAGFSNEQRETIEGLFLMLSQKRKGVTFTENHINTVKELGAEFLLTNDGILYKNVETYLKNLLNVDSGELVYELIENMKNQGMYVDLCNFLLSQIND